MIFGKRRSPGGLLGHKRKGLYPPACSRDYLVQYTLTKYLTEYESATYLIDKLRGVTTGITDGRVGQRGAYVPGDTTREIRISSYPSTAFTYVDNTTGITENGTTDGSGDWLIPSNGVRSLTIDGYTFDFEETNTDTTVYGVASDGTFITGEIQNATGSDRVQTDDVVGQADLSGYAVSKALGKNLNSEYLRNEISSLGVISVNLTALLTEYPFIVEKNEEYTTKVRSNLFTVDADSCLIAYYDADGVFLERVSKGVFGESLTWTSDYDGYARVYLVRVKQDDSDITNEELVDLTVQTELGTTATAYEAYIGFYSDSALTNPVPQGTQLPVRNNLVSTWISDGSGGSYQPRYSEVGGFSGEMQAQLVYTDVAGTPSGVSPYIKQASKKWKVVQADKLLNGGSGLWYDHTDPDNVVANVLAVADLLGTVYNKQHFVAIEEWIQTFYSQALNISCVEKVELFLKMLEQVFVVEGAVMVGTEKVYVLKDEVDQL